MTARPSAPLMERLRQAACSSLLVFPLAALLNSFSMTGLLLVFGLAGASEVAADIGLVQAATLALFYAFSANGRNLVLGDASGSVSGQLLKARLMLVIPLATAAWFLSVKVGAAGGLLAAVLILRRASEWMGEIGLALHERNHSPRFARQYMVVESLTLLLTAAAPLLTDAPVWLCAFPWALAPLLSMREAKAQMGSSGRLRLRELLPHFGSTAAVGISTYVFRISIALLAGKTLAGELFTAFAIGGLLPTLFGQGLAPTLAHRYRNRRLPLWLVLLPAAILAFSAGLAGLIYLNPSLVAWSRHSSAFWIASAASLAGGALMGIALMLRTRLIQNMQGGQVYGPDLMANLLIATCVPFVFYLLGPKALGGLYLLSSALNLAFYWRAGRSPNPAAQGRGLLMIAIAGALVLPVFVQLSGGLFVSKAMVFDATGDITRLPIPISVFGVFLGIALLGNYSAAIRTLTTVFFTAVLFIVSSLIVTAGDKASEGAKLILLAQFLLPMFGLILGEMYGAASDKPWFERGAAIVLLAVIPAQLLATWMAGFIVSQPHVFFFSIYQHLQYFPMVATALAIMASMALFKDARGWGLAVVVLWLLTLLHSTVSVSAASVAGGLGGLALFALWHGRNRQGRRMVVASAALALFLAGTYAHLSNTGIASVVLADLVPKPTIVIDELRWGDKVGATHQTGEPSAVPKPPKQVSRFHYWRTYASGATSSFKTFLFGNATPLDRKLFPSAHNYWLDALYNFGVLAVLPMILLLAATLRMAWQRRSALRSDPAVVGCLAAMVYLMLFENMLKVGMRQPYPGLVTLFIWGLLISRLRAHPADGAAESPPHLGA